MIGLGPTIGIAAAVTLAAGIAGYVKGRTDGAEKWIERAATLEQRVLQADAALLRQTGAVQKIESAAQRRLEASAAELRKADQAKATLASEVQRLLADKPAFPSDPCASACSLLRQPL